MSFSHVADFVKFYPLANCLSFYDIQSLSAYMKGMWVCGFFYYVSKTVLIINYWMKGVHGYKDQQVKIICGEKIIAL